MAQSKGNPRKTKKRTRNHRAPVDAAAQARREQEAEKKRGEERRHLLESTIALVLMIAGILIAQKLSAPVGYAISLAGGVLGIYGAHFQTRGRKITIVCYGVYTALTAYMLIASIVSGSAA